MKENWYALYIAIMKGVSVEKALHLMNAPSGEKSKTSRISPTTKAAKKVFDKAEIEKMIVLKSTMSYKEVGTLFGVKDRDVYLAIKGYKPDLISTGKLNCNKPKVRLY